MNPIREPGRVLPKPPWLRRKIISGAAYQEIHDLLKKGGLHTVCQEAICPNLGECYSQGTATFLILGDQCTRNCRFCAVGHGHVIPPDPDEPARIAEAVERLGLGYVVITSVTRDDLPDGGASHFADTIREIKNRMPGTKVEVLIPDFQGNMEAVRSVLDSGPQVLNHNIETVPRLYPTVRPQAVYERSLGVLSMSRQIAPSVPAKSGLMLGLGESSEEVEQVFQDLLAAGCRLITIGQYLQPSPNHLPVHRFIPPEEFDAWRSKAREMGFVRVACGPFVRSSYHAQELLTL